MCGTTTVAANNFSRAAAYGFGMAGGDQTAYRPVGVQRRPAAVVVSRITSMKRPAPHLALIVLLSLTGGWAPKRAPLMTRWAADVPPGAVLPEYPRPQVVRPDWLNLNGVWEYQPGAADDAVPGGKLSGEILVPFPVESALSGVMEHHDRLWYRRSFTVPPAWRGRRVMLHFGAVDFEAEAFVNGRSVGSHRGGYDPFTFDVTDALAGGDGPQQLTVRVFDPTNAGGQPRGKQSLRPGGIMYTSVTGIWQTVWLEPVAAGGVEHLSVRPNVEGSSVRVAAVGAAADADVTVTVRDGERVVGTGHGRGADAVVVGVPDAKLWSPDRPFLYDVRVVVSRGEQTVDAVDGYFGMRSFGVGTVDGVRRLLLNGKPVFEFGPLDQGFWPDGIYTAPTEAALKSDLQAIKDLGFNMVRKHIKVEPARWYYWADRLGLLVWQDMPSADSYPGREPVPPVDRAEYERELTRVVETLRDVPSVAMWVVFNEGQGQFDTGRLVDLVRRLDPTRPVNEASGGNFTGAGDLTDIHAYPPPSCPPADPKRVLACGEFGGIGFEVPGHAWVTRGHSYTMIAAPADLVDQYAEVRRQPQGDAGRARAVGGRLHRADRRGERGERAADVRPGAQGGRGGAGAGDAV